MSPTYSFQQRWPILSVNQVQTTNPNFQTGGQIAFSVTQNADGSQTVTASLVGGGPVFRNNTKLLEDFGWMGISIDADSNLTEKFAKERKAKVIAGDATKLDYESLIDKNYDYLQIDVDPASVSFEVLLKIPFEKYRFGVITFEHDAYRGSDIRDRSRQYLRSFGYKLVAGDIAYNRHDSFEDWWIHPDLVDPKIVHEMSDHGDVIKKADRYMLSEEI